MAKEQKKTESHETPRNAYQQTRDEVRNKADEDLLTDIIAAFVSYPEDIGVTTVDQGWPNVMIELEINPMDYGKVNGSAGRNITALRAIFELIGRREKRRIRVMMVDTPRARDISSQPPFTDNPDWNPDATIVLLRRLLERIFLRPFGIEVISAGGTTNIEVRAEEKEQEIAEWLKPSLQIIVHSMGRAQGRILYIETPRAMPVMPI